MNERREGNQEKPAPIDSERAMMSNAWMRASATKKAFDFYSKYILNTSSEKAAIRVEYGFEPYVQFHPSDWELFGAILIGSRASGVKYGHDLENAEIKSIKLGSSSFEYQYHKFGQVKKLDLESSINHIFIVYSEDYKSVTVYAASGSEFSKRWNLWKTLVGQSYEQGGQRFRRSIPYAEVKRKGKLILNIEGGEIICSDNRDISTILESTF